jgi:hypothetical protein
MVANTCPMMLVRLSDKGLSAIYGEGPDVLVAGSVHPPMKATPVKGGYAITGEILFSAMYMKHNG